MTISTSHAIRLPPELLTHIFGLATYSPARFIESLEEPEPLQEDSAIAQCDAALETKYSLALSCSFFRSLSECFLYEDIRIRHGSGDLLKALEKSTKGTVNRNGDLVRRISVFPIGYDEGGHWYENISEHTIRILRCCPNIQVLTRPPMPVIRTSEPVNGQEADSFVINDLKFSSLYRVDWYNSPFDRLPSPMPTPRFIWQTPSIRTLTLGPDYSDFHPGEQEIIMNLPDLHTLRVRSMNSFGQLLGDGNPRIDVKLPSLRRLIIQKADAVYLLYFGRPLSRAASKLRAIELGMDKRFLYHDFMSVLLMHCPNTTELSFHVFFTCPTRRNLPTSAVQFVYDVEHVGLSAAKSDDMPWEEDTWQRLTEHFESLCGQQTRFSKLKRITLYGAQWAEYILDGALSGSLQLIRSRRVKVVCKESAARVAFEAVWRRSERSGSHRRALSLLI
ncbi:hypothetical protein EW145_g3133 [Phellinidium pouzarii]|uniref:F-box domain-containing protein n=1 Tax=Phellinidium pouzarii TaxID=167371 RepID=A0A4S4L8G2_9AGAM|nr:hypothetical protein EW145_g3133 [Phellinidium pouzarii]